MEFLVLFCFSALFFLRPVLAQQILTDPAEVSALNTMVDYWKLRDALNLTIDPCAPEASWSLKDANPRISCECSSTICHVNHLRIFALDISGEIPKELFVLKELMDLNLGQNLLSGPIPAEIDQLSKMQYLSLGINNLSGSIPPELGNLTKLVSLSFSSNNFDGAIPRELGKLTNLEQLYIDSSGLSGEIPPELVNLKSLKYLWASDNLFSGKLPDFIGTFTNLIDLRIQGTLLKGPIPSSFTSLTKLEDLRLGDLAEEDSALSFLGNFTSLSILSLRNSRVAGPLPENLGGLPNLKYLDLSFNKLTGQIPNSFQDFESLEILYLGNNHLTGELPPYIITTKLLALDISFNPIYGSFPMNYGQVGLAMNFVGTSMNANSFYDRKVLGMLHCLQEGSACTKVPSYSSFSVNCGGTEQMTASGIYFGDDSEVLGAASFYTSSDYTWAVSNTGIFISNRNGPQYMVETDSQITGTLNSELYKTARVSPSSLRYYGTGLRNGKYNIELHFAEIVLDDSPSWEGLGRRLFDIYIQGKRVAQDFNIQKEAGGSNRAIIKTFETNVTNRIVDIHLFWAGRGTCCISSQGTYGPLVSAIRVYQGTGEINSKSKSNKMHAGQLLGIALAGAGVLFIVASIFYLWWTKDAPVHILLHTDSPRKE